MGVSLVPSSRGRPADARRAWPSPTGTSLLGCHRSNFDNLARPMHRPMARAGPLGQWPNLGPESLRRASSPPARPTRRARSRHAGSLEGLDAFVLLHGCYATSEIRVAHGSGARRGRRSRRCSMQRSSSPVIHTAQDGRPRAGKAWPGASVLGWHEIQARGSHGARRSARRLLSRSRGRIRQPRRRERQGRQDDRRRTVPLPAATTTDPA